MVLSFLFLNVLVFYANTGNLKPGEQNAKVPRSDPFSKRDSKKEALNVLRESEMKYPSFKLGEQVEDLLFSPGRLYNNDTRTLFNGITLPQEWPPKTFTPDNFTNCHLPRPLPPYLGSDKPKVINIDVGRQLFFDDFLIEATSLKKEFFQAKILPGNALTAEDPVEWFLFAPVYYTAGFGYYAAPSSDGVWFDPSEQLFKLFYHCGVSKSGKICMAVSRNGVEWQKRLYYAHSQGAAAAEEEEEVNRPSFPAKRNSANATENTHPTQSPRKETISTSAAPAQSRAHPQRRESVEGSPNIVFRPQQMFLDNDSAIGSTVVWFDPTLLQDSPPDSNPELNPELNPEDEDQDQDQDQEPAPDANHESNQTNCEECEDTEPNWQQRKEVQPFRYPWKLIVSDQWSRHTPTGIFGSMDGRSWVKLFLGPSVSDRCTVFYNPFLGRWVWSLRQNSCDHQRIRRYAESEDLRASAFQPFAPSENQKYFCEPLKEGEPVYWVGCDTKDTEFKARYTRAKQPPKQISKLKQSTSPPSSSPSSPLSQKSQSFTNHTQFKANNRTEDKRKAKEQQKTLADNGEREGKVKEGKGRDTHASIAPAAGGKQDSFAAPTPQIYNIEGLAYESTMVMMINLFLEEGESGISYDKKLVITTGFSRDGFHLTRPNVHLPLIDVAADQCYYSTAAGGIAVVGDWLLFYVHARDKSEYSEIGDYRVSRTHTRVAVLRRDGFCALRPPNRVARGELITRPLVFTGDYLFVNVRNSSAKGRVFAEFIQADTAEPIPGLNATLCRGIGGDTTMGLMRWGSTRAVGALVRPYLPVRIRFIVVESELYSFWVSPDSNGASHGFVGAGGPGHAGNRDTEGIEAWRKGKKSLENSSFADLLNAVKT